MACGRDDKPFGLAPLVMGLILGRLVEESFSQSMIMYDNNFARLFESPIVVVLSVLTCVSLFWPILGPVVKLAFSGPRSREEAS